MDSTLINGIGFYGLLLSCLAIPIPLIVGLIGLVMKNRALAIGGFAVAAGLVVIILLIGLITAVAAG